MALFKVDKPKKLDDKYSHKVGIPQYLPSNKKPNIVELYNSSKYIKLLQHIESSELSDEDKKFLRLAATRHIVFNYDKIADYYAHADNTLQKLMEESALVIIDFNDAIVNGYVEMTAGIDEICKVGVCDED